MRQNGFAQILVLVLLLAGVGVGAVLVQNPQILNSKAYYFFPVPPPKRIIPTPAPKFQGYIIQFKDDPVSVYSSNTGKSEGLSKAPEMVVNNYVSTLSDNHEEAKKDIFSRLGMPKGPGGTIPSVVLGEYTYSFNGIALNISAAQLDVVKSSPYVKNTQPNYFVKATLMNSVPLIGANRVWNLKDSQARTVTGKGVIVGILDTGVDYTHPDLGGCSKDQFISRQCVKIIDGYDFVNQDNDPMDDHSHGTHVAATVASDGVLKGVAPDAKLVAYKILGSDGSGSYANLMAAVDKAVATHFDSDLNNDINIISLSLNGGCPNGYNVECGPFDTSSISLNNAASSGVLSVVSAGNTGPGASTIGPPATAEKAITVGAIDNNWVVQDWSSRGPVVLFGVDYHKPDVVAPGAGICAALSSRVSFEGNCLDPKHTLKWGTSMAAPHVAGFAALVKQMYPSFSPDQIKEKIKSTAKNLGKDPNIQGAGAIYAYSTFNIPVATPTSTPKPTPTFTPTPTKAPVSTPTPTKILIPTPTPISGKIVYSSLSPSEGSSIYSPVVFSGTIEDSASWMGDRYAWIYINSIKQTEGGYVYSKNNSTKIVTPASTSPYNLAPGYYKWFVRISNQSGSIYTDSPIINFIIPYTKVVLTPNSITPGSIITVKVTGSAEAYSYCQNSPLITSSPIPFKSCAAPTAGCTGNDCWAQWKCSTWLTAFGSQTLKFTASNNKLCSSSASYNISR